MDSTIKKYLPYAVVIFSVFMIVPLLFRSKTMDAFYPVAIYCIFPLVTVVSSAIFCSKHGLDFLFALISPVAFIPSMLIYYGGFESNAILANLLLLACYLASGIFGLFIGDLAFGDKRRMKEAEEKAEAEELMLEAMRRDEYVKEQRTKKESPSTSFYDDDDDDFDYDKYLADIDRPTSASDAEIDDILSEYGNKNY